MTLNVVYFAWVRERIGVPREQIETSAETVGELVRELTAKGERYSAAFADMNVVKVAVDQTMVDLSASIKNAKEIAFFPPMTGG